MKITSLCPQYPTRWFLAGTLGHCRIGYPDPLDATVLTSTYEDFISRIRIHAGLTSCPGHLLVYQLRWKWGLAQARLDMPARTVQLADGTRILENMLHSRNEEDLYNTS